MADYMFTLVLLGIFSLYLTFYICKKEYFENSVPTKGKEKPYTTKNALKSLELFITTLNKDTKESFMIYNVESIKQIANKLYIKCFVQHTVKKYVRVYFAELQLPFSQKSNPVLSYYGEYGNGQVIQNGSFDIKDSANYSKFNTFPYSPDQYSKLGNSVEKNNLLNNKTVNKNMKVKTSNTQNIDLNKNKINLNETNNILQYTLNFLYNIIKYLINFLYNLTNK